MLKYQKAEKSSGGEYAELREKGTRHGGNNTVQENSQQSKEEEKNRDL